MGFVTIEQSEVKARTPEGAEMKISLDDLIASIAPKVIDTHELALPAGVRSFLTRGRISMLIHETAPRVFNFKWIDKASAMPFGSETSFRQVRIALPYVIVFAVFQQDRRGSLKLTDANECFFSTQPLISLDQPLSYPALLNCSRFDPPDGHPLSWICTQYLQREARQRLGNLNLQVHADVKALLHCLFETGFNYSSEHHEHSSWFSASQSIDPRIATIEAWQQATTSDPLFALDIPWIPTTLSVGQIAERIFKNLNGASPPIRTADDIVRMVFNAKSAR